LQFEVGIQTFDPSVSRNISRRQDFGRLEDNLRFLRRQTGVHVHADLIAGLPGETLESFASGFDRLLALGPQEIQVGILKRLRGTPIVRHDKTWQMVYSAHPPYEILQNKLMDFALTQRLRRFARYWDLTGNSGNFVETTPLLWSGGLAPFAAFMKWSDWLYERIGRRHAIALARLAELLFAYLTVELALQASEVAQSLWRDWQRAGRHEKPEFLAGYLSEVKPTKADRAATAPKRQARHMGMETKELNSRRVGAYACLRLKPAQQARFLQSLPPRKVDQAFPTAVHILRWKLRRQSKASTAADRLVPITKPKKRRLSRPPAE